MRTQPNMNAVADKQESAPDFLLGLSGYVTDRSPLPLVATEGLEHVVRYVNPAFCDLSGQTQEALIGHPLAEIISEGAANGSAAMLDRVYLTAKTETLIDQEHTERSRSRVYWTYTAWAAFDKDQNPLGVMLQVTDTTLSASRRKEAREISEAITVSAVRQLEQAERAKAGEVRAHKAMRETDHRVKNHLQSICALLDIQTLTHDETVPVAELIQIRSHLRTLASIHDLLARDADLADASSVLSVRQILRQLIPMLQEVVGAEPIQWSADDGFLSIKQGISLAVIINEIVTNAVKHGGRNIEMQVAASDTTMVLSVYDDGPGFPVGFDPRVDAHFGLELLESMSRVELRGAIAFNNRPEGGASVVITFPLRLTDE